MMGNVVQMADYRRAPEPTRTPLSFTRTPALALVMALYAELPRKYRGLALTRVMQMADAQPDCEVSQEAGRIAALLALSKMDGR